LASALWGGITRKAQSFRGDVEAGAGAQYRQCRSGSARGSVVIAFVIARVVRDANRSKSPAGATGSAVAPRSARAVGSQPGMGAAAADEPADSADASAELEPADEDSEAVAGTAPVVGTGPCRFTVATRPARSTIKLDDQPVGTSPITIQATCDKHKLEAAHARYQNLTRWVTPAADKPQEVAINLSRPVHAVTVTSVPPGAELSIDGHRAGITPAVVQMTGFATVHLTFTKSGFRSLTKKVYSKLPQDSVSVKLMR
jgi:PEGA domain